MDKKVAKLLNQQINKEMYSAYIYLDMANFYADKGLDGFRNWFERQAEEEMEHGMKILHYLQDNGVQIELEPIDKPDAKYVELVDPLNKALEHEEYVTSLIHAIYEAAEECKDYRTMQFLQWFIEEQCEEEKDAGDLVKKYNVFAKDGGMGLYHLDSEFANRTGE
jgi:ferritin